MKERALHNLYIALDRAVAKQQYDMIDVLSRAIQRLEGGRE